MSSEIDGDSKDEALRIKVTTVVKRKTMMESLTLKLLKAGSMFVLPIGVVPGLVPQGIPIRCS